MEDKKFHFYHTFQEMGVGGGGGGMDFCYCSGTLRYYSIALLLFLGLANGTLLEIGKDVDDLTGDEKAFYLDQKGKREARLSEEIDNDFQAI